MLQVVCPKSKETQDAYNVMFACKMDIIYKHRKIFEDRYSKYVKGFTRRCDQDKLKEIINVNHKMFGCK